MAGDGLAEDGWGWLLKYAEECALAQKEVCVTLRYTVLQRIAVSCSVLQYGAVWCSVLQCVAVCCSVLQLIFVKG